MPVEFVTRYEIKHRNHVFELTHEEAKELFDQLNKVFGPKFNVNPLPQVYGPPPTNLVSPFDPRLKVWC